LLFSIELDSILVAVVSGKGNFKFVLSLERLDFVTMLIKEQCSPSLHLALLDFILSCFNNIGVDLHDKLGLRNINIRPFDLNITVLAGNSLLVVVDD
jgi:hypothetical protein